MSLTVPLASTSMSKTLRPWSAASIAVAAAIVLDTGRDLSTEDCRNRLRDELSAYKIPRHIFFAAKADLPFTDSGKIDKRRLGAQLADRIRVEGPGDS